MKARKSSSVPKFSFREYRSVCQYPWYAAPLVSSSKFLVIGEIQICTDEQNEGCQLKTCYTNTKGQKETDAVESHPLDVIQLVHQAAIIAAAVLLRAGIARGISRAIATGEAVSEDLVDGTRAPLIGAGCSGNAETGCCREEKSRRNHFHKSRKPNDLLTAVFCRVSSTERGDVWGIYKSPGPQRINRTTSEQSDRQHRCTEGPFRQEGITRGRTSGARKSSRCLKSPA